MKIFIASSLKNPYMFLRAELDKALTRLSHDVIKWEKDKPAGVKVPEGEKVMIEDSDVCVFLLGSDQSKGTVEEYLISRDLEKFIILVNVTPYVGEKADMDPTLKKEIWVPSRRENIITLTWTQSDEVAKQIENGIKTEFKMTKATKPELSLVLRKNKVEREREFIRLALSIFLKNQGQNTIRGVELILFFERSAFTWNKTIFLSPAGPNHPYDYKWSRIDDSQFRLKCLTKQIFPSGEEVLGSVSLLLPQEVKHLDFSLKLYGEGINPPVEEKYTIKGFMERMDVQKIYP